MSQETQTASQEATPKPAQGQKYWRSLDQLADTEEFQRFLQHEFPGFTKELASSTTRRHFLKVMGASFALAGMGTLTGCIRWPKEHIVPFTNRPEGFQPGIPDMYATSMEIGGVAQPLLATSYDGRPIKMEGNPEHPVFKRAGSKHPFGPSSAQAQASVLELYDPDRSRQIHFQGKPAASGWATSDLQALATQLRQNRGGVAVLSEASRSPSLAPFKQMLGDRWFEYEPISRDTERQGAEQAFGRPLEMHLDLTQADVIVSIDSDFLMTHPAAKALTRDFSIGRKGTGGKMNRLYVVEGNFSVTGGAADYRYPITANQIPGVAARLASELTKAGVTVPGFEGTPNMSAAGQQMAAGIQQIVGDLVKARGRSVLVAGPNQPAPVHAAIHAMNQALGNIGKTVKYVEDPEPQRKSHQQSLAALVAEIDKGSVQTLLILGGNPVYNAPRDLNFAAALGKVGQTVHLSYYFDETSALCKWQIPRAHYLEAWGDALACDGTHTLVQPLIQPMTFPTHEAKSLVEFLSWAFEAKPRAGQDIVRKTFDDKVGGGDKAWRRALHDGFVPNTAAKPVTPPAVRGGWSTTLAEYSTNEKPAAGGLAAVFVEDYKVHDGRFANNGWLQELPDPMSKLTWDNAALIGVKTATQLGVSRSGDMIKLKGSNQELEIGVYVLPGIADDTVVLPLGYARGDTFQRPAGFVSYNARNESALQVATGSGFDTYSLRGSSALWGGQTSLAAAKSSSRYTFATTQDHHSIELDAMQSFGENKSLPAEQLQKRVKTILGVGTLAEYNADKAHFVDNALGRHGHGHHDDHGKKDKNGHGADKDGSHGDDHDKDHSGDGREKVAHQHGHGSDGNRSLWNEHVYKGHKWGMAIDLSTCIGCGDCVTACQAENNIAVVGKDEVARGREMHWIRIDRYFASETPEDAASVDAVHQPLTCQQCENAPCESVCPVAATVHSEEGLNDMVYNRCIGTRYCSNNCPFKVRRFNYFNNTKIPTETERMVYNPEVTIRHRGVMEKCTFCVQRIQNAKIAAKNEGREVADGDITPACAQSCAADSIVFGDLSDPESRVSKLHHDERSYTMFEELNVKPRNSFQAKLRNRMES